MITEKDLDEINKDLYNIIYMTFQQKVHANNIHQDLSDIYISMTNSSGNSDAHVENMELLKNQIFCAKFKQTLIHTKLIRDVLEEVCKKYEETLTEMVGFPEGLPQFGN